MKRAEKKLLWFVILGVITFSFLLYGNSIKGGYVLDDHLVVEFRPELKNPINLPQIAFLTWHPGQPLAAYRPLSLASFTFNFMFSDSVAGLHVTNILVHALNATLVFYLVTKFSSKRAALITSILFMFLPIHVEPIASIVGRTDLLATAFTLITLLSLFNYKYFLSSVSFLLALLSKELTIILLPLIGVILLIGPGTFKKSFKIWAYYLPSVAIYFLLRFFVLGWHAFKSEFFINQVIGPLAFASVKERVFTSFLHVFLYLKKTFYPLDLSPDYSFNQIPLVQNILTSWGALLGLLSLIIMILLFIFGGRSIKIAAALFLLPLFVVTNIFFVTTGTMAERHFYLPSVGLMAVIAIGLDKVPNRRALNFLIFGISLPLLIWFSFLIIKQNRIWWNEKNLFVRAVEKSPNSVWARTNLAVVRLNEGNLEEAKKEMEAGLQIYDRYIPLLKHWGRLKWKNGDLGGAEEMFLKALALDTNGMQSRGLYRLLAFLYLEKGDNEDALIAMGKAISYPAFGDIQKTKEIDQESYEGIKSIQGRSLNSYSEEERKVLEARIRGVRGL